jgi:hypothetical protein
MTKRANTAENRAKLVADDLGEELVEGGREVAADGAGAAADGVRAGVVDDVGEGLAMDLTEAVEAKAGAACGIEVRDK